MKKLHITILMLAFWCWLEGAYSASWRRELVTFCIVELLAFYIVEILIFRFFIFFEKSRLTIIVRTIKQKLYIFLEKIGWFCRGVTVVP